PPPPRPLPSFPTRRSSDLEGMRIAVIGDLHVGLFSRPSRLEHIFDTARAQRPDLVVLAGDLVDDDPVFAPKLLAGLAALGPSIPDRKSTRLNSSHRTISYA